MAPDLELVKAYVKDRSDSAFRALVARHIGLVYSTALRQVGDAGAAEEITQNVFITLAKKAPSLSGFDTLAGWLHRAAVLEAKARIRAEIRRRHREDASAEATRLARDGMGTDAPWIPLLDEALMQLREGDRLAVILRFFEECSLREVGAALGVEEDAARKRVGRALDKLGQYLREQGFSVPASASIGVLMGQTAQAAPAALGAACAQAALASATPATVLQLGALWFMNLSKTKTALLCALALTGPAAWQWKSQAELRRQETVLSARLEQGQQRWQEVDGRLQAAAEALVGAQAAAVNEELRATRLNAQAVPVAATPYQWDDAAPLARIPKQLLQGLSFSAISDRQGRLTEEVQELLQMLPEEAHAVQTAMSRFVADYALAQTAHMKAVEPTPDDLRLHPPEETRVFEVADIGEDVAELRATLFAEIETALGAERWPLFKKGLEDWMPIDDRGAGYGFNTRMAVFNFPHRVQFYKPKPGDRSVMWGISAESGRMSALVPIDDIPPAYRLPLNDWIAEAQSQMPPAP